MKVPKAKQLPSGSWRIQVRIGEKRVSITEPTEKACLARAMAVQQEMLSPVDKSQKPTLTSAIDHYIESRQNILSPATIRGYRTIQKNRFQTAMSKRVNEITDKAWQRIINAEAKLCSSKTLKNAWGLVSSVLSDELGRSPSVTLPQVISDTREFLDPDQIKIFLEAVKGTKYEIAALLALHSLRCSEILALTWGNIDLERKIIHVRGAVVPNENNEYIHKKENKNSTSRREVPIMIPRLAELLQNAAKAEDAVVRCHPNTLRVSFNKICASANLPEVGTHGLRHSFASLAYHLRMPEKVAMQIGGWSNDATMRKIYTHVSQKDVLNYQNAMASFYST